MKTTIALIVKFIATMAAAWISFMLFGQVAFWTVAVIALAGTVLNYLIGDLLVLPRFGNVIASILDGILAGALAWMVLAYTPVTYTYMTSVYMFAVIVAVAEFFFHMYLISSHTIEKKKSDEDFYKRSRVSYNTETGSELYPYSSRNNDNSGSLGTSGTVNSGYNKSCNQQDNYRDLKSNKDNKNR